MIPLRFFTWSGWYIEHLNRTYSSKREWKTGDNECLPWCSPPTNKWSSSKREWETNASLDVLHLQINDLVYPTSCAAILLLNPSSPSGYYSIRSSNGSPVSVYCDLTLSCGNITGGWLKVAELDMTDNSNQCPSTLTQRIDSNKRTCAINSNSASCAPVIYSIDAIEYSKVCGKILGYQFSSLNAFAGVNISFRSSIGSNYVDGISLTHGRPRKHIWTFVGSKLVVILSTTVLVLTLIKQALL